MARTMKKFSAGGAQGRYDRRMADIEKDYKKAMARKTGRAAEVAEAKRMQRIADAKDDLAKRTGADRSATSAAERAAESNLKKTRKYGAPKAVTTEAPVGKVTDTLGAITAPKSGLATSVKKTPAKTPVKADDKPKPSAADLARAKERAKAALGASNLPGDQGFSSKSKVLGTSKGLKTGDTKSSVTPAGPSTKTGVHSNSIAARIMRGDLFKTSDAFRKSQEAKYGKAKGGKIMKYAKGGSTPPKPTAADRAAGAKFRKSVKDLKVTPEQAAAIGRGNRSTGMAKGGKAKAKPFAATKFGAAMKKKSADTKGRAMMKFAKGGSIDGCAVKGKTKTSMVKMKNGGSC